MVQIFKETSNPVEYFPSVPPNLIYKLQPTLCPRMWTFFESIRSCPYSLALIKAQTITGLIRKPGGKIGISLAHLFKVAMDWTHLFSEGSNLVG